ncbi:DUF4873 domain-containing protein [Pseudonocardia tropica]|uniref:DUF4873 domain-containing protein n=1 Tax=Pseudonocardia tropica TaxID=681289 RepID=A0ABV1JZ39_9PSEU
MSGDHDHDEGCRGPATLVLDGATVDVEVLLDARHGPFDRRPHRSGRVAAHPRLTALLGGLGGTVEVRTPGHAAVGTLSEPHVGDRFRITGTGGPPSAPDGPPPAGDRPTRAHRPRTRVGPGPADGYRARTTPGALSR